MFKRILHGLVLLALLAGMLAFAPAAPAAARADSKGVSPEGMLNANGTLKLDADFRGALDLEGYSVQLDPALGPVLMPIAALDNWAAVAEGGGAFTDYISAIVVNGTDVYVGGAFRNAGGNPEADYIAKWDGIEWSALGNGGSGVGALSGTVHAMGLYGGVLYVGGNFSTYNPGGSPMANATSLAIWDGAWMEVPGITSPLNGPVYALGFDATDNILYFGGYFTNVNGDGTADRLAGIDFDTTSLVTLGNDGSGGGSLNSSVFAIGVDSSGDVYAGGGFTNVNNGVTSIPEADYLAKWDGANWSALGNNGAGVGALNGGVYVITISGSDVYAGGYFTNAAGIAEADKIAKWNGAAWSALGSDGSGNGALNSFNAYVYEIAVNGSDIYVGGTFTNAAGLPAADYAARFDTGAGAWHALGSNGAGNGSLSYYVSGMAFSGGNLYLGGLFYDVNNGGTVLPTADYFAIWSGSAWSTLGDSNGGLNGNVNAIAKIGTDVYVGGSFSNLGGDFRMDSLVRWDGSAWNPVGNLTQTLGSLNGPVSALAVDGTNLYVGGDFTAAQNEGTNVTVNRIAKWDGSTWSALGSGMNGSVWALAVDASHNVYAGGNFTDAASIPEADYIAMWNGSAWSALAGNGAGNGALNSYVSALAVSGSNVYVGGGFTSVVDTSNTAIPNAPYLAKWNGSAWSAMDGITSPLDWNVYALAVSGSDLYVGGHFWGLNGMGAASRIAKWNGSTWSALGSDGSGGPSLNGPVRAIVVNGGDVYVGGIFTNVNNGGTFIPEADSVAKWDGANWSALGSNGGGNGSLNDNVEELQIIGSDLWVGGLFTNVNNGGTAIPEADFLAAYGIETHTPANGAVLPHKRPAFDWEDIPGAIGYQLQVAKTAAFSFGTLTKNSAVSNYTFTTDLAANTLYYWRVRAKLTAFTYGPWLTVFTFTTGNPPSVPTLVSPANNALQTNLSPTLDWSNSTVPAGTTFDHYQVQVDDTADFSSPVVDVDSAASTAAVGPLSPNTKYYWRVRSWNTVGHYSSWSAVRYFREAMLAPTLVSPLGGITVPSLKPTFDWNDVTGATSYTLQVSLSNIFSFPVINATIAISQYTATVNLQAGKLYYWRVRANGPNGPSAWSTVESFTTP